MRFKHAIAGLLAAAVTASGCGGGDAVETPAAAPGGNGTDRAFAQAMVPHHASAVEMAGLARTRAESPFVRELAGDIDRTQRDEIRILRREDRSLAAAGVRTGSLGVHEHAMGMDDDPAALRGAQPFDEAFLRMMVPHHEGAIAMAEAELERGSDPELRALAGRILRAQEREIEAMRAHLGEGGAAGGHATHGG